MAGYVLKINNLYFEDDEKFQGAKFHTANWDKSVSIKALKTTFHIFSYTTVNQYFRISFGNCFRNHDMFCGLGLECRFLFLFSCFKYLLNSQVVKALAPGFPTAIIFTKLLETDYQ